MCLLLKFVVWCFVVNSIIYSAQGTNYRNKHKNLFGKALLSPLADMTRQGRFLSLFTFVQFNNQPCLGTTGNNGTCMSLAECSIRRGAPNGPCAAGYGTCCIFLARCGTTIRENGTYFVNDGYPKAFDGSGTCQVSLAKSHPDVCQYRIDFDQFTLMGPETVNHVCNNDQFIVLAGGVPVICGNNAGNHLYINADASNLVTLSVVTSGPSYPRSWKMRISQIPCNTVYRAEEGCLQYFTGVAGQIRSFNYDPSAGLQLSNQDYGICIRNERNFCAIQYTQCLDPGHNRSQSFTLSGNTNNPVPAMVGSTGTVNSCQTDYLIVPMAISVGRTQGPTPSVDRICGGTLGTDLTLLSFPVRSTVKPFHLWFHTDGIEAPNDVGNRGFCLNFIQQPCNGLG